MYTEQIMEENIKNEFIYIKQPIENNNNNILSEDEVSCLNALVPAESRKIFKKKTKKICIEKLELTYDNYVNDRIDLKSYTLQELKVIAKSNNIAVSGKKDFLIERIKIVLNYVKNAIVMQKYFRGWLVRFSFSLRGPALKNRDLCVNGTDFITMEPLNEIPQEYFYSYADNKEFIYGFNVASLMQMIKTKSKVENPYNREKLNEKTIETVKTLYNLSFVIYETFRNENELQNTHSNRIKQHRINRRSQNRNHNVNDNIQFVEITAETIAVNRLLQLRARPINERITNLFMEIDSLGNYTQSSWFSNLDRVRYIRLYRNLYEIWNYRSNLSREVKQRICPNSSPFDGIFPRVVYHNELSLEQMQNACLMVFENMIYLGVDEDHRKLGTFHALSGLTLVSDGARQTMPWLYESVAY